jgi:hypothetical protein
MNERIFELAKEADLIQWDTLPSGARTPDHESVVKAKKFAELIVRECSGIVQNYMSRWPEDCDLVIKIKEHFGVEE